MDHGDYLDWRYPNHRKEYIEKNLVKILMINKKIILGILTHNTEGRSNRDKFRYRIFYRSYFMYYKSLVMK